MTPQARSKVASLIVDWLRGGQLVVSDGESVERAPLTVVLDDTTVVVSGSFDELAANFHWLRRDVIADDGTVVDSLEQDFGVKALGAVWTLEVPLEVQ